MRQDYLSREEAQNAMDYCIHQVDEGMKRFYGGFFPAGALNGSYICAIRPAAGYPA